MMPSTKKEANSTFAAKIFLLVLAALFGMVGTSSVLAQTGHASISGVVMDSQGAVVAGANVAATNLATGVVTTTTTNGSGAYNIIQVIPGVYTVKVEKEGFSAQVQENYTLVAEQNAGINFTLQPGKVSEKVTVQAGAELVHTESAELGQTINEESIDELPLNGRNPASLVLLTPGTVDVSQTNANFFQSFTTFPTETGASVNGGRQGSVLYLLDGVYNMDNYQLTAAPFPNPDATQEFSVIGNNFDARFGFTTGGVVSIVTKSGTNNWHGDLFEFLRNGALNSKDYFTGLTDETHRNQFGGSLGGPVVKDKLFVFGNYQGTRLNYFNAASNVYVPSTAMRTGDFSALCLGGFTNGLCNDRDPNNPTQVIDQIWKPLLDPDHSAADAVANPALYYPGNEIPTADLNPGAVALANLLPPTTDRLGHLTASGFPVVNDYNEETGRVDYNINGHQRLSGHAFLNFFNQPTYSATLLSSNRSWVVDWQNYGATWTWTINPHIVNSLNGAYSRMYDTSNSGLLINGKNVCFSQFVNVADNFPGTPCSIEDLEMSGGPGPGFGIGQNFNGINRWTYGFSDSLSIAKGKHLIALGVDALRQYWYENTNWQALPLMQFDGGANGNFTGYGFSDFLLGQESYFDQGGGESNIVHAWLVQPYVADQYKVSSNLTVSGGLRWEPDLAPVVSSGRIPVYWPGHQSTRYPNAPPGIVYPGDAGVPNAGIPSHYDNFSPRVGIAWQPRALPNTSVRAAFGMYSTPLAYDDWNPSGDNAPFSPTYTFSAGGIIEGQQVPIIPFSNPWSVYTPTGGVSPFPPFADPNTSPGPTATFSSPYNLYYVFDRHFRAGENQTWNLSIEHQFGSNWLARAAYVGSEAYHLPIRNSLNPGQFFCGPVGPNCTQAEFNMNGTLVNPEFNTMVLNFSEVTSSYNSGQFTLERRMSHGLQFTANYTYSHTIDDSAAINTASLDNPFCLQCNRANSDLNFPQIFVANFIYTTPTLAGWNGATRGLLAGWEVSGIFRAQSGIPFTIVSGLNQSYDVVGTDHANYASSSDTVHVNHGSLTNYIVASDFTQPGYGNLGDTGRNIVAGPGTNTWDMGFDKNFRFGERYRFQFRWEMFNAFNRPTFGQPNNNLSSGTFGQITYSQLPPRTMQAALKFYF